MTCLRNTAVNGEPGPKPGPSYPLESVLSTNKSCDPKAAHPIPLPMSLMVKLALASLFTGHSLLLDRCQLPFSSERKN